MWIVSGSLRYCQNIVIRRISTFMVPFPNLLESTLTVPATLENNGTTVQCMLESAFSKVFSSCCTLTVLPGKLKTMCIILILTVCVIVQVLVMFTT